jgi:hemoglobin-like flavoprotein
MMTADQRRLIRQSFDAVREQAIPVSLLFYGKLFELDPSARRLFHNDLAVQGRKVMDTLDWLAQSLDRFESTRGRLADLGRQHAGYGVRPEQYQTLITALLWALAQALGPDFDAATREAWTLALRAVAAAMQEGARQL